MCWLSCLLADEFALGYVMVANDFPGYELIVISACVLGGFLKGGLGKVSYVVASVLISGTVENAMNLLNISPFAQYVVRG